VGLSKKQLGQDEAIVVEVRGHRGPLMVPLSVVLVGAAVLITASIDRHLSQASLLKIVALVIGGLGIVALALRTARWRARVITVTNQRVVVSVGGVRPRRDQVSLDRIVEVQVNQSLSDHLFGRGDLVFELVDGPPVVIGDVTKPEALRRVLVRAAQTEYEEPVWQDAPESIEHDQGLFDWPLDEETGVIDAPDFVLPRLVSEFDPTPPQGTPAVSAPLDQDRVSRLRGIDDLEATGVITPAEAHEQRQRILRRFSR
jgi:hypothetical protein